MFKGFMQRLYCRRPADDLQLLLLMIVAGLAFAFITPFTVFRIISGHYLAAAANTIMILTCIGCAIRALQTGQARVPGMVISAVFTAGMLTVTLTRGVEGLLWFYPLIIFVFHLTPPGFALVLIALGLGVVTLVELLPRQNIFPSGIQHFSFLATSICVVIFSYTFAKKNTQHRKKLQDLAARDGMTNLKNRRSLENELEIIATSKRDMEFGLIILDLDNLKTINDQMGHPTGDRILTDLAHLLARTIRRSDEVYRYGGDEFVVLVANVNAHGLTEVCRNLAGKINESMSCKDAFITVSMGAALLEPADSVQEWFHKADVCLYHAKGSGRNTYLVHNAEQGCTCPETTA